MQIFPSLLYSPSRKSMLGMAVTLWVMRQDDDKIAVLMRMTDVMCICPARLVLVESPALLLHCWFIPSALCFWESLLSAAEWMSTVHPQLPLLWDNDTTLCDATSLGARCLWYLCCCVSIFPFLPKLVPFLPKLVPGWYLMHAHDDLIGWRSKRRILSQSMAGSRSIYWPVEVIGRHNSTGNHVWCGWHVGRVWHAAET